MNEGQQLGPHQTQKALYSTAGRGDQVKRKRKNGGKYMLIIHLIEFNTQNKQRIKKQRVMKTNNPKKKHDLWVRTGF